MASKSLMLSDTAMALLRQYAEVVEHYREIEQVMSSYGTDVTGQSEIEWLEWNSRNPNTEQTNQLRADLLEDIWIMWLAPDLQPVRRLDWHLVLEERIIAWGEGYNLLSRSLHLQESIDAFVMMRFANLVLDAYTRALVARTVQTVDVKE